MAVCVHTVSGQSWILRGSSTETSWNAIFNTWNWKMNDDDDDGSIEASLIAHFSFPTESLCRPAVWKSRDPAQVKAWLWAWPANDTDGFVNRRPPKLDGEKRCEKKKENKKTHCPNQKRHFWIINLRFSDKQKKKSYEVRLYLPYCSPYA